MERAVPFALIALFVSLFLLTGDCERLSFETIFKTLLQKKCQGVLEVGGKKTSIRWAPFNKPLSPPPLSVPTHPTSAVTYELSGGRLGDNLIAYLHARWIADRFHLPLVRIPFQGSEAFQLHELDPPVNLAQFKRTQRVTQETPIDSNADATLYVVPYFSECAYEQRKCPPPFIVQWDDPTFQTQIARCLSPKEPPSPLSLPTDKITIGVHVRRGGNIDAPSAVAMFPLKFPSDAYYLEQIERIARLYPNQPLHIHLFTDDPDPKTLAHQYRSALSNPNLTFSFRTEASALDDFYAIPHFDCLILPQSHFSLAASKLGQYTLLILPAHGKRKKGTNQIDRVEIHFSYRK